jgi:hypothetical protein
LNHPGRWGFDFAIDVIADPMTYTPLTSKGFSNGIGRVGRSTGNFPYTINVDKSTLSMSGFGGINFVRKNSDELLTPKGVLHGFDPLPSIAKKLDTPNVNPYRLSHTIENGTIHIGGKPATGSVDFVITEAGELRLGSGHFFLYDSANSVKAAGQLYLKNGKIDVVTNWSGHYQPTVADLKRTEAALKNNGLFGPGAEVMTRGIPDKNLIPKQ